MPITRTPMIDDDGTGTTGTILNNAWKQELYGQIDAADAAVAPGAWVDIPFNVANFGATGGTWTVTAGNVLTFAYRRAGALAVVQFRFQGTVIAGAPNVVTLQLAAVGVARNYGLQPVVLHHTSGQMGPAAWDVGGTVVSISRDLAGTPFPAGTLHLGGALVFAL